MLIHVKKCPSGLNTIAATLYLDLRDVLKEEQLKIIRTFLMKHEHLSKLLYILLFVNSSDTN